MTALLEQAETETILHELDLQGPYRKIEVVGENVVMSPLRAMHGGTIFPLQTQLAAQLPDEYWFVYDVLTPFKPKVHEYCPDLAVIPKAEYERNISVCKPEWIKLVIEVISPTTRDFDYGVKVDVYARAGIPEYVVFDPYDRSATRYAQPEGGEYTLRQVIHYGKPVRIETPFSVVIETAGLPVDPES